MNKKKAFIIGITGQDGSYLSKFLTEKNRELACNECSPCVKKATQTQHHQKYLFQSSADVSTPYGYESSDLKNIYLSREDLQNKKFAPSIPIEKQQ